MPNNPQHTGEAVSLDTASADQPAGTWAVICRCGAAGANLYAIDGASYRGAAWTSDPRVRDGK
jgi:hypothetical protein